ncbi:DUF6498-containing protein [Microlunatus spumicola]|uniref:DUF6498-containing protein n=1 Tax=Microlunatus spumicola TaxID=81499 RepID=UPI0019595B78
MTPDQRPSYPRTPAYGEGFPVGGAGPRPGTTSGPPVPRRPDPVVPPGRVRLALGLSVALNLLIVVGVLVLGWPAGNVFVLFWAENVVLGLVTLVRISTAGPDGTGRLTTALFFVVHYGIFCAVHAGFTAVVAWRLGTDLTFVALGLPVALVVLRYAVELATWFGPEGLREWSTPSRAAAAPYPRLVVLHVGLLIAFGLVLVGFFAALPDSPLAAYDRVLAALPPWLGRPAVLAVVALVVLKTLADVPTTRRALRYR